MGYSLWGCKRVRLDLAIIQQQYTNVHCELPKEGSEYGLSHIYLTMESGFFFFKAFILMNSVSRGTYQEILVTREQRCLDHPICLQMDHFDLKVSWAVVQ